MRTFHPLIGMVAAATILGGAAVAFGESVAINFEDLTTNTTYDNGDIFTSGGVPITLTDYEQLSGSTTTNGSARVQAAPSGDSFLNGNVVFASNTNLDFDFGFPAGNVTFSFVDQGGSVNLSVNDMNIAAKDFSDIEAMTDPFGEDISFNLITQDSEGRAVRLFGLGSTTIDQFSVGGQEFNVDGIFAGSAAAVPQPRAFVQGVLMLLGLAVLMRPRRARKPAA